MSGILEDSNVNTAETLVERNATPNAPNIDFAGNEKRGLFTGQAGDHLMPLMDGVDLSAAYDANSLNKLHQQAAAQSPACLEAVAKYVKALLVQMMLKNRRDTLPQEILFG